MIEKETPVIRTAHDSLVIPPVTLNIPMPEGAAIPIKRANSVPFDKENASTINDE